MANKTMKTLTIGNKTYEVVDETARAYIETLKESSTVDTTLTQEGKAADAKAVGDAFKNISVEVDDTLTQSGKAADAKVVGDAISNISIEVDTTLSESGKAADAKAVGDAINEIPIAISEDGYTEITGLRQAISTSIVKSGNAITVTTALEGDESTVSEITLDNNGYPTKILTDGVECIISWEGFVASTATIDTTLDEIIGEVI